MPTPKSDEKSLTVFVSPDTYSWLSDKAKQHGRARCREITEIIESAKKRDSRHRNSVLSARA